MRLGSDIAGRLMDLALVAVRCAAQLPRDPAGRHVASQLVRAATGGGANYEEARAAESRDDFIHKVGVAAKEVREAAFWLALIQRSRWLTRDLHAPIREAGELAAILGASARTARARGGGSPRSGR
jgi:four helix bundle protein